MEIVYKRGRSVYTDTFPILEEKKISLINLLEHKKLVAKGNLVHHSEK